MARFLIENEENTMATNAHPLLTDGGYFERAREVQNENDLSGRETWATVEQELRGNYGLSRFLDYEAFRQGKSRWYKRVKKRIEAKRLVFYAEGQ